MLLIFTGKEEIRNYVATVQWIILFVRENSHFVGSGKIPWTRMNEYLFNVKILFSYTTAAHLFQSLTPSKVWSQWSGSHPCLCSARCQTLRMWGIRHSIPPGAWCSGRTSGCWSSPRCRWPGWSSWWTRMVVCCRWGSRGARGGRRHHMRAGSPGSSSFHHHHHHYLNQLFHHMILAHLDHHHHQLCHHMRAGSPGSCIVTHSRHCIRCQTQSSWVQSEPWQSGKLNIDRYKYLFMWDHLTLMPGQVAAQRARNSCGRDTIEAINAHWIIGAVTQKWTREDNVLKCEP